MCKGLTKAGKKCQRTPKDGYCYLHKDQSEEGHPSKEKCSSSKEKCSSSNDTSKHKKYDILNDLKVLPSEVYYQIKGFKKFPYKVRSIQIVTNTINSDDDIDDLLEEGKPRLTANFEQRFTWYHKANMWDNADARPKLHEKEDKRSKKLTSNYDMLTTEEMIKQLRLKPGMLVRIYIETNLHSTHKDPYTDSGLSNEEVDDANIKFDAKSTMKGSNFISDPSAERSGIDKGVRNHYGGFVFYEVLE